MKTILYLFFLAISSSFFSCDEPSSAKITDKYIEIVRPGGSLGLIEVKPLEIDSTFGYPTEEKEFVGYTIVHRKTHEPLNENASVKMYFNVKNDKYCWAIRPDPVSAVVY